MFINLPFLSSWRQVAWAEVDFKIQQVKKYRHCVTLLTYLLCYCWEDFKISTVLIRNADDAIILSMTFPSFARQIINFLCILALTLLSRVIFISEIADIDWSCCVVLFRWSIDLLPQFVPRRQNRLSHYKNQSRCGIVINVCIS